MKTTNEKLTVEELVEVIKATGAHSVTVFANGRAQLVDRWGGIPFPTLDDLICWVRSGKLVKENDPPNAT